MAFHDIVFPSGEAWGTGGGPGFNTSIVQMPSGQEQRVARWEDARHSYDVSETLRMPDKIAEIKAFFLARGGAANGFKYLDKADYTSSVSDPSYSGPGAGVRDQTIGVGDGSTTTFQLSKLYSSGAQSYSRKITKPLSGTVRVWVAAVEKTIGVDFTVDLSSGVVTMASAPAAAASVEASFQFYVPVRFSQETDRNLRASMQAYDATSLEAVLEEILDGETWMPGEAYFGGATERSSAVSLSVDFGTAHLWIVAMTTTGKHVALPDPTSIPPGIVGAVQNGGSNAFAVKSHSGSTIVASLTAGQLVDVMLSVDVGGAKVWVLS